MKKKTLLGLAVAVCLALAAWAAADAGENVWVSRDGEAHAAHGHATLITDEGESFDLSELADGQTRTFGTGDKQITVTRDGDVATIKGMAHGDGGELKVTCRLGEDTCEIITVTDDPSKVMVMVYRSRKCVNGEGDCDETSFDVSVCGGDAHAIAIRKVVRCDDDGNCTEDVSRSEDPDGRTLIDLDGGDGTGANVFVFSEGGSWVGKHAAGDVVFVAGDDKVTLRCPEGDTTMRVDKSEAQEVFLCPKHSVPLEKVAAEGPLHEIHIEKRVEPREY